MKKYAIELRGINEEYRLLISNLPEEVLSLKPVAGKWSKKEELGHLIDSAQNNIRRFIVAQYENNPRIVYNQNYWVAASAYQNWESSSIINLWYLLNIQLCEIWSAMDEGIAERTCDSGHENPVLHSIRWLAGDYIKHQLHHLHHLLDMEHIAY